MAYNACIHSKGKDEFKASYISSGISSSLSKLPSTLSDPNAVATCFSLYSLPLMVTVVSLPHKDITSKSLMRYLYSLQVLAGVSFFQLTAHSSKFPSVKIFLVLFDTLAVIYLFVVLISE